MEKLWNRQRNPLRHVLRDVCGPDETFSLGDVADALGHDYRFVQKIISGAESVGKGKEYALSAIDVLALKGCLGLEQSASGKELRRYYKAARSYLHDRRVDLNADDHLLFTLRGDELQIVDVERDCNAGVPDLVVQHAREGTPMILIEIKEDLDKLASAIQTQVKRRPRGRPPVNRELVQGALKEIDELGKDASQEEINELLNG